MNKKFEIPLVFCSRCFCVMDISEWLAGFESDVGSFVPHPASSHPCGNCGYLWEPENDKPGDKMISDGYIMFFWELV